MGDDPAHAPRSDGELRLIAAGAASVAGLAVYVYIVGWADELVRFTAARLPAPTATAALSAGELVGYGMRCTALTAVVFAVCCAAAYGLAARHWRRHAADWHAIAGAKGVRNAAAVRVAGHTADPPALGDWAIRLVAGFNILILSALVGLLVGRGAAGALPVAGWIGVPIGLVVFGGVYEVLTRVSPLAFGVWGHALAWGVVALAAVFASAPIGVLVLTGVGIATLGRALARIPQPQTVWAFLRSPLPWVLLTICLLLGLAENAVGPVPFPATVLTTADGPLVGGYVTRTDAGVYLATCVGLADATSTDEHLQLVPAGQITGVRIASTTDYLDSGERPSIAGLAFHALGIGGHPPTLFDAALRARQPTCSGAGPERLTTGTADPQLGTGVIAGPAPAGGRAGDGEPPIASPAARGAGADRSFQPPAAVAALARRYQPTVLVSAADRNWPVSVDAVLAERGPAGAGVCLVQQRAPHTVCPPGDASFSGPGAAASDYLQLPVALAGNHRPSGQFQAVLAGQSQSSGTLAHWLADPGTLDPWHSAQLYFYYGGVVAPATWAALSLQSPVRTPLIALEYWFYYPFNYYPLVVDAGLMAGAPIAGDQFNVDLHQGDWEHVDVLLDPATGAPRWLFMARHSSEGQFVAWGSPSLPLDDGHPVIQAAFGGHPSYLPGCGARPRPITHDASSDWLACGSGRFAFRAATTPLVDVARTTWACWPGHFGEASTRLEVDNAHHAENVIDSIRHFVFVAGPVSPLEQAENKGACAGGDPTASEQAAPGPRSPGSG